MSTRTPGQVDALLMPPPLPAAGTAVSAWRRIWLPMFKGMAFGGVIGILGGVAWSFLEHTDTPAMDAAVAWLSTLSPGWVVGAGLVSLWPHILLHEAGHALAGMAGGMRPIAFGLGRWRWERGA